MFPLQPQPLPGSCQPGYVKPRRPPLRKHRRLVYDWLVAKAVETIGPNATPCNYLCARLHAGATSRELADEARAWVAVNRPGAAASTFPGRFYIDRYPLRNLHGPIGTPDRDAIEAAKAVSHALSAARTGARLTAGRAAARARRATNRSDSEATTDLEVSQPDFLAIQMTEVLRGQVRPNIRHV